MGCRWGSSCSPVVQNTGFGELAPDFELSTRIFARTMFVTSDIMAAIRSFCVKLPLLKVFTTSCTEEAWQNTLLVMVRLVLSSIGLQVLAE